MIGAKSDLLFIGPLKQHMVDGLAPAFNVHVLQDAPSQAGLIAQIGPRARAFAVSDLVGPVDGALMRNFPHLEIVSTFGVGYDHVDARWAGEHGIVVTNTPDVLTEEVADTALALLISTLRELPQAERHLRSGQWALRPYRLSRASLRDRTVGMVGMGRIGQAIARRLDACGVPIVYHSRRPQAGVAYRHYPDLIAMAREVDVLMVIVPGGPTTRGMINAAVLDALGPRGVVINVARGSVIDEPALIAALRDGRIASAGLDVFCGEPHVAADLIALENAVLLPHVGSASEYTRRAMDQLVVDNLLAWAAGQPPLTPVPEAPWPPRARELKSA